MLACAAAITAAAWVRQHAQEASAALAVRIAHEREALPPSAAASAATAPDFTATLGAPLAAAQLVQELQRACVQANATLAGVQATERRATRDELGRLDLVVSLRGSYPNTKQVLKQVVERFPGVTVQRLRMRRNASSSDTETSVTLSAWSPPLRSLSEPTSPPASGSR